MPYVLRRRWAFARHEALQQRWFGRLGVKTRAAALAGDGRRAHAAPPSPSTSSITWSARSGGPS